MKIALTGHTIGRLRGKDAEVRDWLATVLMIMVQEGDDIELLCGGAEGADEIFGDFAFWFPQVKLRLCLPIKGYRGKQLDKLKERANSIYYAGETWERGLNTIRDRYMVDNCDVLLAVWDGIQQGGTWTTIKYARKKNKRIIYINKEVFFDEG